MQFSYLPNKFCYKITVLWPPEWNFRYTGHNVPCTANSWWRPWLEVNVGKQGDAWQWDIPDQNSKFVEIGFINESDLVLFNMVWN